MKALGLLVALVSTVLPGSASCGGDGEEPGAGRSFPDGGAAGPDPVEWSVPVAEGGHPGPQADLGAPPPAPQPDQSSSPWSCEQIGSCADQCGIDQKCMDKCASHGCVSAKSAFAALSACGESKCMFACMFDPASSGCESCINSKCAAQLAACAGNKC